MALAGPHTGAATALIRALGMEGSTGLSAADIKALAANPLFPALYQPLPAPGVGAVVERKNNRMAALDLYAPSTRARLWRAGSGKLDSADKWSFCLTAA